MKYKNNWHHTFYIMQAQACWVIRPRKITHYPKELIFLLQHYYSYSVLVGGRVTVETGDLFCWRVCLTSTQPHNYSSHTDPFPPWTKLCSASLHYHWEHICCGTRRKSPEYQRKTPLFWFESDPSRSARCCWENLIYKKGDRKYEQSSALAWFNEGLEMGFVCALQVTLESPTSFLVSKRLSI